MTQLFISLNDHGSVRQSWHSLADRMGVAVTSYVAGRKVLPLTGDTTRAIAALPNVDYMDVDTHDILGDCIRRSQYLPVLPAARTREEVMALTGPVFIKPRLNSRKGLGTLTYTRWDSGAEMCNTAWDLFSTEDLDVGGLVALPDLGSPMSNLEIDFAVNADGVVRVMHCFTHGFNEHNRPTTMKSGADVPETLMQAVQAFCLSRGVRGGIFNIQAVQHEGVFKIMDWNARPTGMYRMLASHPGVAEVGLAHMLGLSIDEPPTPYIELRSYWDRPIPNHKADLVRSLDLGPSWVWSRQVIGRVYCVAASAAEADARFAALEAAL
jgi:hypothetical protein